MNKTSLQKLAILYAVGIILLLGCDPAEYRTTPPILEISPIVTVTEPKPTIPASKPAVTLTNSPSIVVIPPSPTATSGATPIPTLPPGLAVEQVINLLKNNNNCKLPCFWGITPGKTTYDEARQIIVPIAYNVGGKSPSRVKLGETSFGAELTVRGDEFPFFLNFFLTNDKVVSIVTNEHGTEYLYQLKDLLSIYGMPDHVLLTGWPYNEEHQAHFGLIVEYYDKGILARYNGDSPAPHEMMEVCPQGIPPQLILWDTQLNDQPGYEKYLIDIESDDWGAPEFQPLVAVTDLTIDSFYELMLNGDLETCFQTPTSLWE